MPCMAIRVAGAEQHSMFRRRTPRKRTSGREQTSFADADIGDAVYGEGHELSPVAYFTRVFRELPHATTAEHIDALMPARFVAEALLT